MNVQDQLAVDEIRNAYTDLNEKTENVLELQREFSTAERKLMKEMNALKESGAKFGRSNAERDAVLVELAPGLFSEYLEAEIQLEDAKLLHKQAMNKVAEVKAIIAYFSTTNFLEPYQTSERVVLEDDFGVE